MAGYKISHSLKGLPERMPDYSIGCLTFKTVQKNHYIHGTVYYHHTLKVCQGECQIIL
jgi:hypothetical protein